MEKNDLFLDIKRRLNELNVPFIVNRKADIEIFEDEKDEKSNRKQFYLGFILLNRKDKIIKIYENGSFANDLNIIHEIDLIAQKHVYSVQKVDHQKDASYPIYIAYPMIIFCLLKKWIKIIITMITKLFQQHDRKSNIKKVALISLVSIIFISIIILSIPKSKDDDTYIEQPNTENQDSIDDSSQIEEPIAEEPTHSSKVSYGVNPLELGNIPSGQFYFETETDIFYSCYDEENQAHIYRLHKETQILTQIFDGFGWSLVVYDQKLYFSGNPGSVIDGTYNLYRMNLDGSQLENLVPMYTYNMFFYDGDLYYVKMNQSILDVYKIDLETLEEQQIIENGRYPIIYNHQLYYADNLGNLFRSDPNGQNKEVLAYNVSYFIIGNEKIIYYTSENDIYYCDLNGQNQSMVHHSDQSLFTLNNIDHTIYFIEYGDYDYLTGGRNYSIHRIDFDGANYQEILSKNTYLLYANIINQRLYTFVYTLETIYIETVTLEGLEEIVLER